MARVPAACFSMRASRESAALNFSRSQASGARIPIIFMTAHGDIPMVRKVMKAGAIEFLTKPFQKNELLHAVQQAFAQDRSGAKKKDRWRDRSPHSSLSHREREVMAMVTAGLAQQADRC